MWGIPGSGKSFTANKFGGLVLSTDEYWGEDYQFDLAKLSLAHEWNRARTHCAMKSGEPLIVIDNTNTTEKEWSPYVKLANLYGYEVEIGYPESPWWNSISERIYNNTFTESDIDEFVERNTHNVPRETIRRMMVRFENHK